MSVGPCKAQENTISNEVSEWLRELNSWMSRNESIEEISDMQEAPHPSISKRRKGLAGVE